MQQPNSKQFYTMPKLMDFLRGLPLVGKGTVVSVDGDDVTVSEDMYAAGVGTNHYLVDANSAVKKMVRITVAPTAEAPTVMTLADATGFAEDHVCWAQKLPLAADKLVGVYDGEDGRFTVVYYAEDPTGLTVVEA